MMIRNRRDFLKAGLAMTAAGMPLFVLAQEPALEAPKVYVCPLHADVQSKLEGKCPKCNTQLVLAKGGQEFFICPMHPEVMANSAGKCQKCSMELVKTPPPETTEYDVILSTIPIAPKAGRKVELRFNIFHPTKRKQVKEFNILHEMPFHLFVVSQDLVHFDHIHPEKMADGSFKIQTILPKPGYYKIFCDFFPAGGMPQVSQHNIVTAGYQGDLISSQAHLVPDKSLVKTIDGTQFELKFDPVQPFSGKPAELHYHLKDEKTGEPVRDLQPYLGAWGHTLILSEDATDYLHSHPTEMIQEDIERSELRGGPDVVFDTFFPRPGNYRVWSQFQRQGKITTVSFTIEVPRLR
jgi:Heavy metal binding domain